MAKENKKEIGNPEFNKAKHQGKIEKAKKDKK